MPALNSKSCQKLAQKSFQIFSLRERPELAPLIFSDRINVLWPKYTVQDTAFKIYFSPDIFPHYQDYVFAAMAKNEVVGRAFAVPFAFNCESRNELPDCGWDQVIRWSHEDLAVGRPFTTMSALEISLVPEMRGEGGSLAMLNAFKACAKKKGFTEMFAPVRPNEKHLHPHMSMQDYIALKRADGLPVDPWLRTHIRNGGRIEKIAPCSMSVVGTLDDWSRWLGKPFEQSGEIAVKDGLVPVQVSLKHNHAVYIEPNVWVRHHLEEVLLH